MNERHILAAVDVVDTFEANRLTIEDAQAKLQSILNLLEHQPDDQAYDAIDLAENNLEEILHARVQHAQRDEALSRLRELRVRLVDDLTSYSPNPLT